MKFYSWYVYAAIVFLILSGCNANSNDKSKTNLNNTVIENIDQSAAVETKKIIARHKETTAIHAVNSEKTLLAAFEIRHLKRFGLEDLKKKIEQELTKRFPDMEIEVSTDQKILMETEKLEKRIAQGRLTKKRDLDREIEKTIKLAKEKT